MKKIQKTAGGNTEPELKPRRKKQPRSSVL